MFGKVAAIGLEIEGPWNDQVPIQGFVGDFHNEYMPNPGGGVLLKECVSVPLKNQAQVNAFFDQIRPNFVEKKVLDGMGFHIHFSFEKSEHYDVVFSPKFVKELTHELFKHFEKDDKLQRRPSHRSDQGTNFFKMEYPDEYWIRSPYRNPHDSKQTDGRKNRYYMVNFWRALEAHHTFELRILPANTVQRMQEYVQWVLDFINTYLENHLTDYNVKEVRTVLIDKDKKRRVVSKVCNHDDEEFELEPCKTESHHKLMEQT